MRKHAGTGVVVAALAVGLCASIGAQERRASPHEKAMSAVDGAKISVEYGRPYVKGRKIFGGLVPFGQVWRTGADEATTLVTDQPLVFGALAVPAGSYSLYTIPGEKEWTLIINKQTGQWGTQYSEAQDLGRVTMKASRLEKGVEQFTITVADTPAGGEMQFDWDQTRAVAPFTVKK
jgi:hypothetical protein